jgi:glucose/arabinose dehydrogenase
LVETAKVPDYALGSHTASLGLVFSNSLAWPAPFNNGAFIGQHGSWNREPRSGYQVIFVPFRNSKPFGSPIKVLTGFVSEDGDAFGRPVGVVLDKQQALLVADDVGNTIWRVTAVNNPASP